MSNCGRLSYVFTLAPPGLASPLPSHRGSQLAPSEVPHHISAAGQRRLPGPPVCRRWAARAATARRRRPGPKRPRCPSERAAGGRLCGGGVSGARSAAAAAAASDLVPRSPGRPAGGDSAGRPLGRAVSAPGAAPLSSTLALSDESLGRDANSSSSESVSSQRPTDAAALQRRETELRRKEAALQQQYARLQAMHGAAPRPAAETQPAAAAADGASEAARPDQP